MNVKRTTASILIVLVTLAALAAAVSACGDGGGSPRPTMTLQEFYDELQPVHAAAAAEVTRADSELQDPDRMLAAADAFDALAAELDELTPPVETILVDEALAITARVIAEELRELAEAGETTSETLERFLDDYEFACRAFVDTARATIGEVNLDCRYGYQLID